MDNYEILIFLRNKINPANLRFAGFILFSCFLKMSIFKITKWLN